MACFSSTKALFNRLWKNVWRMPYLSCNVGTFATTCYSNFLCFPSLSCRSSLNSLFSFLNDIIHMYVRSSWMNLAVIWVSHSHHDFLSFYQWDSSLLSSTAALHDPLVEFSSYSLMTHGRWFYCPTPTRPNNLSLSPLSPSTKFQLTRRHAEQRRAEETHFSNQHLPVPCKKKN